MTLDTTTGPGHKIEMQKLDATTIAGYCLSDERSKDIQISQTKHRIDLLNAWNVIKPTDKILEIGCGQGDMTAVLASAASSGHVTALDPAPLDYGSPFTLGQAQAHLKSSPVGSRIDFIQSNTMKYLSHTKETYDAVVLAQCIWYFSSPYLLLETLKAIKNLRGNPKLLIAEFSLESKQGEAIPHLHAVLAQATLEAFKEHSTSNIQTVVSPLGIQESASEAGWTLASHSLITPDSTYADGRWEVGAVLDSGFMEQVNKVPARQRAVIKAMIDCVRAATDNVGRINIRSMDIWVGVFE